MPSDGGVCAKTISLMRLQPPTAEEHRAASLAWLGRIGPTLIDQWPADVLALSAPTIFVPAPVEQMLELFGDDPPGALLGVADLAAELDAKLGWERRFIRLNSRSPKDALWPLQVPVTCSGREALLMMGNSERVLDDLIEFKYVPEQPALICLRQFNSGIRPEREYRCFVRDGEMIAVTHYDYLNPRPAPEDGGRAIRAAIDAYFRDTLKPRLHMDTVVFDVFIGWDGDIGLIELNPYGRSDPCWLGSYEEVERFSGFVAFSAPEEGSQHLATHGEARDGEAAERPAP